MWRWAKFLWPSQNIGTLFMEHQWNKSVLQRYPFRAAPAIQTVDPTLARRSYLIVTALLSILLSLHIARCHITSTTIISLFVVYGVIEPSYQLFFTRLQIKWWEMGNKLILNGMRHRAVFYCVSRKKWEWYARAWFLYQQKRFKQANLYQNMIFYIQNLN